MEKMNHKIELMAMLTGALASTFVDELVKKIIITSIAMLIGTTVAFYWKIYLEKRKKK